MDLSRIKKIYMIGIKGVGMTMLAQFLTRQGFEVSGSDIPEEFMTDQVLRDCGVGVKKDFDKNNIPADADLIIYSTAYNKTNPEVARALAGKIKTLTYPEALSEVFNQYYGIAVTGSHGKTTTTAWLGYVLMRAGLKPNVLVGARVEQFQGSAITGGSDYLIVEADEYKDKLRYFDPEIVLLNNIEHDHHDYFRTEESYIQTFMDFVQKIPDKGFLVANFDDSVIAKTARVNCRGKVISYGLENQEVDYRAYDLRQDKDKQYFKVQTAGEEGNDLGDFSISLTGQHDIYNALAVIATAMEFDIGLAELRTYLEEFQGTHRRAQIMGKFRGAVIMDDYAHHPGEIETTLDGIRQNYPENNMRVIFHPHTFSRTKALLDRFARSFDMVDELVVLDIYGSAREEPGGVHSRDLVEKIKERTPDLRVSYISTLKECEEYLRKNISSGDLVVLMGAGDVFRIGENLIKD